MLVEKSSCGCYHLDPAGVSLKGLPFSITLVVHCGHCFCLSLASPLLQSCCTSPSSCFHKGRGAEKENENKDVRVKNGSLNIVSNAMTGCRGVGWVCLF